MEIMDIFTALKGHTVDNKSPYILGRYTWTQLNQLVLIDFRSLDSRPAPSVQHPSEQGQISI